MEQKWPKAWEDLSPKGNLLPKSNAFLALMKFLRTDVYLDLVGIDNLGKIPSVKEFSKAFDDLDITDKDFTTRNFSPGSGGQSVFYKLLRGEIRKAELFQ